MVFVEGELLLGDLSPLEHSAVCADLFQSEQVGAGFHHTAGNHDGRNVDPPNGHQLSRNGFITTGYEHACVKSGGIGVDLDQIGNGIPGY